MGNGSTAFDGARNPVRVALVGSQRLVGGVLALALSRDPRLVVVTQILDPAQALRECHDCLPDVVALDLAPAAADPLGALAALTAGRPDCPVLVLTALEDEAMLTRALGCGARGYLTAESSLAELAGGGATPLAAALEAAAVLGVAERAKGRTPVLVIMTDGRGNIALDGAAFRTRAETDALNAARRIRGTGMAVALIDVVLLVARGGAL